MVAELERDNHPDAATLAREVLKTVRSSLDLMKRHLRAIEERKTQPAKARIGWLKGLILRRLIAPGVYS
jgi:hypothetical protein